MLKSRRTALPLLLALELLRTGFSLGAGNDIALRPLPTNSARIGEGLGLFHAGPAQWTLERGDERSVRPGIWAGPADFNGDGRPEWVLSAPLLQGGKENAGKVWILSPDPTNSSLKVRWSWTYAEARREAGSTLAIGDFNGDGYSDLAIGMPGTRRHIGEVLLFAGNRTNLSHSPVSSVITGPPDARIGVSLQSGDVNRDGFADLVVGANRYRFWVRDQGSTEEPQAVGSAQEPTFVIESLASGQAYEVFVSAVNAVGGESALSVSATVTVIAIAA